MRTQSKELSFKGQSIYVGLDVHLKSWSVTIMSEQIVLKRFTQAPNPKGLHSFLTRTYPDADYYSVYEAGYCGFWIHYGLTELGIHNIVVNPADVPTTVGEKLRKTDKVDSTKLARSLCAGTLKGIYIPDNTLLEMRSLIRMRDTITKDLARQKNRIKSHLQHIGIWIPVEMESTSRYWSRPFIDWLNRIGTDTPFGRQTLDFMLGQYEELRARKLEIIRALRALSRTERFAEPMRLLMSVPGIGQLTGLSLISEIDDINRFKGADKLAAYIGMIPMCHSSGEL